MFKKADEAKPISNRAIGATLNVNPATVDRDVAAANASPPTPKTASEIKGTESAPAANAAPALPSGERVARLITNKGETTGENQERRDASRSRARRQAGTFAESVDRCPVCCPTLVPARSPRAS